MRLRIVAVKTIQPTLNPHWGRASGCSMARLEANTLMDSFIAVYEPTLIRIYAYQALLRGNGRNQLEPNKKPRTATLFGVLFTAIATYRIKTR